MKKKILSFCIGLISVTAVVIITFYVMAALRYLNTFSYKTVVSGVDITGKSVEEANMLFIELCDISDFIVSLPNGDSSVIAPSSIDYSVDYKAFLSELKLSQKPFLWPFNKDKFIIEHNIGPDISLNIDKLSEALTLCENLRPYYETGSNSCEIRYSEENGYYLYNDLKASLDHTTLLDRAYGSIMMSEDISVPKECLIEPDLTADMLHEQEVYSSIEAFLVPKISFDFGSEVITVDRKALSDFLVRDLTTRSFVIDENGIPEINEAAVSEYIDKLLEPYNTYKKPRKFITHLGEEKQIDTSVYGTLIDNQAEKEYLMKALKENLCETHTPKYIQEGYVRGLDDIGDTRIEVDLTRQTLYYLCDGEVKFQFDIVSGLPVEGRETPEVVAFVYKKQKARILRGADYSSYVDYWMPFYYNDGFHDASWQRIFGGDRYLKHGSHGCINMRPGEAKQLYEEVEIGIPVIVYK